MTQMTFDDVLAEMKRRKTKRDDLLEAFQKQGELYTGDILMIAGTGMSSRLKELKRRGHIIIPSYEKPGLWRYTYLGERDDEDNSPE